MTPELKKAFAVIAKETVTVREAANILGLSSRQIVYLVNQHKLEGEQLGVEYRIVSKSLDRYAKSLIAKEK